MDLSRSRSSLLRAFYAFKQKGAQTTVTRGARYGEPLDLKTRMSRAREALQRFKKTADHRTYINKPLTISEKFSLGLFSNTHQTLMGDVILNRIMITLTEFTLGGEPFVLRSDQQKMISYIICAFLPFIYRDALESNKERILKRLKMDKIREELVIMAARRVGKTTCIAVVVATIMIVVPCSVGAIFSLAMRASKRLMGMIRTYLQKHPVGAQMLAKAKENNSELIVLVGDHPTHQKVLQAFPDKSDEMASSSSSRYVSLGILNLDASNREHPELNETKKFYDVIESTVATTFQYPTVLTFTETVNEEWIHQHFEEKTAYWGRCLKVGTKIYTAWNRNQYNCTDIVRCQEGRYVAFLLENRITDFEMWHVSIHGHKKKTETRREAMLDLVKFCREVVDDVDLVTVAGDFNESPQRLATYLPENAFQLAIKSNDATTTRRGSSVDNSFCTAPGTYLECQVDRENENFSHHPIKFTIAL